jgi:hypothetical protein
MGNCWQATARPSLANYGATPNSGRCRIEFWRYSGILSVNDKMASSILCPGRFILAGVHRTFFTIAYGV